ncbi:hypothetical protein MMC10_001575 [Thelotrema lepadinum]|nr:hypothetical protein [Thelotrema lepadinum]
METNLTEDFFDRLGKDYEDAYANNEPLHELIAEATDTLPRQQYYELLSNFWQWLKPHGALYLGTLAAEDYDADPEFPIEKSQWDSDGQFVSGVEHKFMGDRVQISMLSRKGWTLAFDQAGFEVMTARGGDLVPARGHLYGKHDYYYVYARKRA